LWEVFTLTGCYPQAGQLCVDLGACPGGWTWVLAGHGARVFCLDRSPLDPRLEHHPLVHSCRGSGFGLDPRDVGKVDWLFSDMICYPDKLWTLVERWLELDAFSNAVCTLKFQGETDHASAARFAAVPGSRLLHLGVNRHELTWILLRDKEGRCL
jgi:23S rRNA (cytidine2498-2'-O)-methyltransferase